MLPPFDLLLGAADAMLAPAVRSRVPPAERRAALAEQLRWGYDVAAQDPNWGREYRSHQPIEGLSAEDYLDRWLPVGRDLGVLAGPRFRDRDPAMPYVGISAADRPIEAADLPALVATARTQFSGFAPRYVNFWSGLPASRWPGTTSDSRLLAGDLQALRERTIPRHVRLRTLRDMSFHGRYLALHEQHRALDAEHRRHTRPTPREILEAATEAGTAWSIDVRGTPAGFLVTRSGVDAGLRGAVIADLILAPSHRGQGIGSALGGLVARELTLPSQRYLIGHIHHRNHPAYRAAIAGGRSDLGGEVLVPIG